MLVVMDAGVSDSEIERVVERMIALGFDVHRSSGMRYTVLGGIGDAQKFDRVGVQSDAGRERGDPHHQPVEVGVQAC